MNISNRQKVKQKALGIPSKGKEKVKDPVMTPEKGHHQRMKEIKSMRYVRQELTTD